MQTVMERNEKKIKEFYSELPGKISSVRKQVRRPLTLTEKILYSHYHGGGSFINDLQHASGYKEFRPDMVAMQDATAQMALLQFIMAGKKSSCVPVSVHCDHLVIARSGEEADLRNALEMNSEIYDFLRSASQKYGFDFHEPGYGIIHQTIFENYAFPGGMMIGTDSHTPAAGGMAMIAIGAGGSDAVDVMTGIPWELNWPSIIGVKITGKLNGWASPKDVILKLAGMLTVRGATGSVIEYFGDGCNSLSATGKATICNMGAETGATCSIFGFDDRMSDYLTETGRKKIANLASAVRMHLNPDPEVVEAPEKYYSRVIEIDLSELEPCINGPFSPDLMTPLSKMKEAVISNNWPDLISEGLIGSCTNSSYEDLVRAASVIKDALDQNIKIKSGLKISPGSRQIRLVAERDGLLDTFTRAGAAVFANACGPCIGQWEREGAEKMPVNTIIHSFNRNFTRRADGNPNTHAFVASPEIVAALSVAGSLSFNPVSDFLIAADGSRVMLKEPSGPEFPSLGFLRLPPQKSSGRKKGNVEIIVDPGSGRIRLLEPFPEWDGNDLLNLPLLIKASGKCTTDHISMAGRWLKYRGHLENISQNYMSGAINFFNGDSDTVLNRFTRGNDKVHIVARAYKEAGTGSVVVGEENFGEGSSREHAAMEPRFLGVKAIIAKSFARIHESNLKKQGLLALTFIKPGDYSLVREDDTFDITGLKQFAPGKPLSVTLHHSDGTSESFPVNHSYNDNQISWFRAGSALNLIKRMNKNV